MKSDNLDWLVTNTLNGDVSGDNPEDLKKIMLAGVELAAMKKQSRIMSFFSAASTQDGSDVKHL